MRRLGMGADRCEGLGHSAWEQAYSENRPLAKLTLSAARVEELARPEIPFRVFAADAMGMKYAVCELADICKHSRASRTGDPPTAERILCC